MIQHQSNVHDGPLSSNNGDKLIRDTYQSSV